MEKYSIPRPERESTIKYRRDVNRQIIFPIVVVTILGIGLTVFSAFSASRNDPGVGLWADISIIWLIIPMMVLALIVMALMLALVYGMRRLLKISPHYTGIVQEYVLWLSAEVKIWNEKITQPVISIKTWLDFILKREE